MIIYCVIIMAYDYWKTCDRDGFVEMRKYFTTEQKAKDWIKANPRYIWRGYNIDQTEAEKDYQMPTFNIVEITVE